MNINIHQNFDHLQISRVFTLTTTSFDKNSIKVFFRADPRQWSRQDVVNWLENMSKVTGIHLDSKNFPMNGRGLNLMTSEMFSSRIPEKNGVALWIYLEFRYRIKMAT